MERGQGLRSDYDEQRKRAREFWLGQARYDGSRRELANEAETRFERRAYSKGLLDLKTADDVRQLVTGAGLTWAEWQANTGKDIKEITAYTDERWQEIAERALAVQPDVFSHIPDPIILINGKYLLTQNTIRRRDGILKAPQRVLQSANWIIRQELEGKSSYGVKEEEILFREQREPKEGQFVRLKDPQDPNPDKVDVEWLYTYISEDGQVSDRRFLDELFKKWSSSVYRAGVWDVKLTKTPAGQWSKEESKWTTHHRIHQSLVLAWEDDEEFEQGTAHGTLWIRLGTDPRGVGTEKAARALLGFSPTIASNWARKARSEATRAKMSAATARALETGDDQTEPQSPVFVIDGTYRVDGTSAGGTTEAFQIMNWIVQQRLEGNW